MGDMQELIQAPLSSEELALRYRALCEDKLYANLPGKIELDPWGRMVMSPASYYHGTMQVRLARALEPLGGHSTVEAPIITMAGIFVADVSWASNEFFSAHVDENPLKCAPEICIEVLSPSNSVKEIREKIDAYLAAGAQEVWVVSPQSERIEFYGRRGELERSRYNVDLSDLFKT